MNWTFAQYDATAAIDIRTTEEVWRLDAMLDKGKGKKGK
jgi:hypothetical protein